MSKPYRIRVQDSVVVGDYASFQIDAPPLSTPQEFSDILAEVMEEAGWTADEDGKMSFEIAEGQRYVFAPDKMRIETVIQDQRDINEELEGWSVKAVNEKADRVVEETERELGQDISQKLEETKEERRELFEGLVVEATGRALKDAAQRLGDVQDIHEERSEDGTYRLTISIQERE
jgi:hypothetical protein